MTPIVPFAYPIHSAIRALIISVLILTGPFLEKADAERVGDQIVGIVCDPFKLGAGSENILEAVKRLNALIVMLNQTEQQTNADLKDRISQVQGIVNDVIAAVERNVADIDSRVKEHESMVAQLEQKINDDASALMFQVSCVVERAGSDQVRRTLGGLIADIKNADPHIEILGIRVISLVTKEIEIVDPDKAYLSVRKKYLNDLNYLQAADPGYNVVSTYSNIIRFAKYASCHYPGNQNIERDLLKDQLTYKSLLAPWLLISPRM